MLKSTGVVKKLAMSTAVAGMLLSAPAFANAANASSISTHQILNRGDRGQAVTTLQSRLDSLNYYNYAIDGIYGPITVGAVRNYQKANNLKVDGIAGPNTLGSLFSGQSSSVHNNSSSAPLRVGDRGSAVRNLQSQLRSLGYYSYTIDGIYGSITASAVRDFQRANGLAVDGIAGPVTFGALNGDPASSVKSVSTNRSNNSSSEVVDIAKGLVGTPYVWGGTSPSGFDCSGFLNYVFEKAGVNLNRTTNSIWNNNGSRVSSPSIGDIVFFQNTYSTNRTATHAGIYIGGNKIIHAGSDGVEISNLSISYWQNHFLGVKSII